MQVRRDETGITVDNYPSWVPLFIVTAGLVLVFLILSVFSLSTPLEECTRACGVGNVQNFSDTTCECK